jgi:hypothetical protein
MAVTLQTWLISTARPPVLVALLIDAWLCVWRPCARQQFIVQLQVAGSGWKLVLEGQPEQEDEPRFSTWDEVRRKQEASRAGFNPDTISFKNAAGGSPVDASYYNLLGVAPSASQQELRAAYRQLALRLHPDVSEAADATQLFGEVAAAYDVLSDSDSRALYDRYGAEGMKRHAGEHGWAAHAGWPR